MIKEMTFNHYSSFTHHLQSRTDEFILYLHDVTFLLMDQYSYNSGKDLDAITLSPEIMTGFYDERNTVNTKSVD